MAGADIAALEANLDRVLSLEQQTSSARASIHEALCNLLQSRTEISTSGAMLSAATRTAMGKRGIAQLEAVKGLLDMASDTAALVRTDATSLRDEVQRVVMARDVAQSAVAEAEATSKEICERVEAQGAAAVLASNEVASRASQEAATSTARAEAAELRAGQAERGYIQAEKARAEAAASLAHADAAREEAVSRLAAVESQLAREREVLARVMAENVLFVKKVEFAEAERARALEEAEALRTQYRTQTEEWFATAAAEMQQRLLADWGAADGLQGELASTRQARAHADAAHKAQLERVTSEEARLRTDSQQLGAECEALRAERTELQASLDSARAQLSAAQHGEQQQLAQAEVRQQQLEELKAAQRSWAEKGEAAGAATLELRATLEAAQREVARLTSALEQREDKLRLTLKVSERVRAEASAEHTTMLETQARLETMQEQYDVLMRQNSVLVKTTEGLVAGA